MSPNSGRSSAPVVVVVASAYLAVLVCASPAQARTPLPILVGKAENLQYLAFFTALGAGYFADEGIDVSLVISDRHRALDLDVKDHVADAPARHSARYHRAYA